MILPPLPSLPPSWRSRVFGKQNTKIDSTVSGDTDSLPDAERLAFIGDAIVHLGITKWLHERYPHHRSQILRTKLMAHVSEKPGEWAKLYKFQSYLIVSPSGGGDSKPYPISKGDLFRAYAGAVYLNCGGDYGGAAMTSGWIGQMMEFAENEGGQSDSDDSTQDESISTGVKDGDEISGMLNGLLEPTSISDAPPQLKSPAQLPVIPTSNTRNFLSLLNEKATQKKKQLIWEENPTGPDHAKTWEVKLNVEGVEGQEFVGAGQNKQRAKSSASEIALRALNWI